MEEEELEKLKSMLDVEIDRVEEDGDKLTVYVPEGQAAKAIGSGGSVVRSVELVLDKKLEIEETD
ncbi:transcription elongation factor NusA [candidate division MSBL1 archaeon SCGC-AAA259E19]|uniref:Transcription elongation factor NusA n=1 Tax=candidate division MSBL1 archaeon SCGC-AAA259E19 TaxID=1698264 RepID=A0A133ULP6_9EURY|nr:transcription elongation factor NusA [candidate division MSBL1 archaeon SCGC-AAA259E19]